jgi:hypothetical protein
MPPDVFHNLDRLIDDAVEQAEASVSFVSEGYGPANMRGMPFVRGKRATERDDEEDD